MSSATDRPAVDVRLKPSARAHHLLFWLHVMVLVMLPAAVGSGAAMVALAFGVALSWVWLRRHTAFGHGPRAVVRILASPDGRWRLENRDGEGVEAELLGDTYVQSWILILNFRAANGRRRTRILLGDETTPEALRRLRARLAAGEAKVAGA